MSQDIQITWGEDRREKMCSNRTYFFYVSPTRIESNLGQAPGLKQKWGSVGGTDPNSFREITTAYQASQEIILKMVTMRTEFGKAKRNAQIFIRLKDDAPRFRLKGFGGMGMFEGRGIIVKELTSPDSLAWIADLEYIELEPGKIADGVKGRTLIFDK